MDFWYAKENVPIGAPYLRTDTNTVVVDYDVKQQSNKQPELLLLKMIMF